MKRGLESIWGAVGFLRQENGWGDPTRRWEREPFETGEPKGDLVGMRTKSRV